MISAYLALQPLKMSPKGLQVAAVVVFLMICFGAGEALDRLRRIGAELDRIGSELDRIATQLSDDQIDTRVANKVERLTVGLDQISEWIGAYVTASLRVQPPDRSEVFLQDVEIFSASDLAPGVVIFTIVNRSSGSVMLKRLTTVADAVAESDATIYDFANKPIPVAYNPQSIDAVLSAGISIEDPRTLTLWFADAAGREWRLNQAMGLATFVPVENPLPPEATDGTGAANVDASTGAAKTGATPLDGDNDADEVSE